MNDSFTQVEQLAEALGIGHPHEFWKTHWQEFKKWQADGGCGIEPGHISPNAQKVFDLPQECMIEVESVCERIKLNPALAELAELWHFLLYHLEVGRGLAEDVLPDPTKALGEQASLFRIAVLVSGADHALDAYRAMGVSKSIVLHSLAEAGSQVRDHYAKHGVHGMKHLGWTRNYLQAKMFRLGRLVFNPNAYSWAFNIYRRKSTGELQAMCASGHRYRNDGMADGTNGIHDPNAWVSELEVEPNFARGNPVSPTGEALKEKITLEMSEWEPLILPGEHIIDIHIPGYSSGGKMQWEECLKSYRRAIEFFQRHYPDYRFKCFACWSWLLDPNLAKILPAESNIVKFLKPFHLVPVVGTANSCYDLVFGDENLDITQAQGKTSLQRAIIAHVTAGNHMRTAAGYITMDEMKALAEELD